MSVESRAIARPNGQRGTRLLGCWCAAVLVIGVIAVTWDGEAVDRQSVLAHSDGSEALDTEEADGQQPVGAGTAGTAAANDAERDVSAPASSASRDTVVDTPAADTPLDEEGRPAQPGAPPSVPTGPATAPAALAFGFNESGSPAWTTDQVARAVADIRPGAVLRFPVEWASVQSNCAPSNEPAYCRTPQPFDWAPVDRTLTVLQAHGLRALPFLTSAPRWAWAPFESSIRPETRMPPRWDDAGSWWWSEFVYGFVEHATNTYPGVLIGVEIWNEQNGNLFWTTSAGVNPTRYKDLLCDAFSASNAVAPDLPVAFGGTGFTTDGGARGEIQFDAFISAAYDAGARGCFDTISMHPYILRLDLAPDHPLNRYVQYIDRVRAVTAAHRDAGREIWVTEIGYPNGPEQAARNLKLYDMTASIPDVGLMLMVRVFDPVGAGEQGGVCVRPGVPKPTASALKQRLTGSSQAATC